VRRRPSFTIGIEEEFQVISPETGELRSHVSEMLEEGKLVLREHLKPEFHQSVLEVGTGVCADVAAARRDVLALRAHLVGLARKNGMRIAAAGTHPFSHWADVGITPSERYEQILSDLQMVARANLIFGLHVHVGIEDREDMIHIMNAARYFVPHILALTVNSPFWLGRDTGWQSYRCKVFDKFPRTNVPDYFASFGEFDRFMNLLLKTNCIRDRKQVWWDLRPHSHYSTLEFRMCDVPMRADETLAVAALIQAVTCKLWKLLDQNLGFRLYRRALVMENKLRAARWGVRGKLIDFRKEEEVPTPVLIEEILEFVDDVVDELGSRDEIARVPWIVQNGTGADRQLAAYRERGSFKGLMDFIADETETGLTVPA
jgi:carboxylate-amine ligase